jgi:hypothetical protein
MKTNDLRKGDEVTLVSGWRAIVADNKKGNIRMCDVFGIYRELGSVYAHDIIFVKRDGRNIAIEHTPQQNKLRETVRRAGL